MGIKVKRTEDCQVRGNNCYSISTGNFCNLYFCRFIHKRFWSKLWDFSYCKVPFHLQLPSYLPLMVKHTYRLKKNYNTRMYITKIFFKNLRFSEVFNFPIRMYGAYALYRCCHMTDQRRSCNGIHTHQFSYLKSLYMFSSN